MMTWTPTDWITTVSGCIWSFFMAALVYKFASALLFKPHEHTFNINLNQTITQSEE